jgi:hypothetical protein
MKTTTILKLKLETECLQLDEVAAICRQARNAAVEDWLLRSRGKRPAKDQKLLKSESGKLYRAVTAKYPELGSSPASCIAASVARHFTAKLDWRRGSDENGKRPKRGDAILNHEDRLPWFTQLQIPLHNRTVAVKFTDKLSVSIGNLLSGRGAPTVLELSTKKLPGRIKKKLHAVASGEAKLCDSYLLKKGEQWYWYLPFQEEVAEACPDIEAELTPVLPKAAGPRATDRFFVLKLPGGRTWYIGDGRYLAAQVRRLTMLRKQIGWRYRQGFGAGHGRRKIDAAVSKRATQERNIRQEVMRRAICDIVNQCKRHNVGTLVYREPTDPAKTHCWFDSADLTFDWTRFIGDLTNRLASIGTVVSKKKLKIKEVLELEETA